MVGGPGWKILPNCTGLRLIGSTLNRRRTHAGLIRTAARSLVTIVGGIDARFHVLCRPLRLRRSVGRISDGFQDESISLPQSACGIRMRPVDDFDLPDSLSLLIEPLARHARPARTRFGPAGRRSRPDIVASRRRPESGRDRRATAGRGARPIFGVESGGSRNGLPDPEGGRNS